MLSDQTLGNDAVPSAGRLLHQSPAYSFAGPLPYRRADDVPSGDRHGPRGGLDDPLTGRSLKHRVDMSPEGGRARDEDEASPAPEKKRNKDIYMTRDDLRAYQPVIQAELANRERFERWTLGIVDIEAPSRIPDDQARYASNENNAVLKKLITGSEPDGRIIEFSDAWVHTDRVPGLEEFSRNADFYFAFGDWTLSSKGDFEAVRVGDTIEVFGTITHLLDEPYNTESVQKTLARIGLPNDVQALEKAGLARPFCIKAVWCDMAIVTLHVMPDGRLRSAGVTWKGAVCTKQQKALLKKQCDA